MALDDLDGIANVQFSQGQTIQIVDDFEDGDMSEWFGNTGRSTVQTGTVWNGTYALGHYTPGDGKYPIASTSGLPYYPQAGDTFRIYFYPNTTDYVGHLGWAQQNNSINGSTTTGAGYEVKIRSSNCGGEFDILKDESNISNGSISGITNQWNYVEIVWGGSGSIDATVYAASDDSQIANVSATDSTYTSGGISIGNDGCSGTSHESYYDFIHVP